MNVGFFTNLIHKLRKKKDKPLIITGDLNVAHKNIDVYFMLSDLPGCSVKERIAFNCFLKEFNLVDCFRELYPSKIKFTFWSNRQHQRLYNMGLRLDYFLISRNAFSSVIDCRVKNNVKGSDHCPIELELDLKF